MDEEQVKRLTEIRDSAMRSWINLRFDRGSDYEKAVAYAKIEMIENIAHIFGVELKPYSP